MKVKTKKSIFIFFMLLSVFCSLLISCVNNTDYANTPNNESINSTFIDTTEEIPNLKSLTIASYNIRHGADVSFDMSIIAQDLMNIDAEIVGLQEIDNFADRSNNIDTMALLAQSGNYPYYKFTKSINIKGGEYGTGILSKYPIVEYNTIALPSGGYEQRTCAHAVIDIDGVLIDFFNTHLSFQSTELRASQFEKLAQMTALSNFFIITGDFNTNIFSEYNVIENSIKACNYESSLITFPSTSKSIDNIIISDNLKFDKIDLGPTNHSDHRMLYAVITY